jgi:hypothetical protein
VTVATLFRGATTDRALGRELLGVEGLPAGARRLLGEKVGPVEERHERPEADLAAIG